MDERPLAQSSPSSAEDAQATLGIFDTIKQLAEVNQNPSVVHSIET